MRTTIIIMTALLFGFSGLKAQKETKTTSIHISDFCGHQEGKCIRLSWIDNDLQSLEDIKLEKSEDGILFSCNTQYEIKTILWAWNFECTDHEPEGNIMYYRLKRFDKSGSYEYSDIIFVNYEKPAAEALVFPNPVQGKEFFVNVSGGKTKVSLYTTEGKLIHFSELDPRNDEKEMKVESPLLESGIYHCIIEEKGKNPKKLPLIVKE